MIMTVTLNPAIDKTVIIPGFAADAVNRVQSLRLDPGGKGINVSKSVHALGGETLAMGILGGAAGQTLQQMLDALQIPNDMVFTKSETRTNLKIVDPQLHTNTDINEAGAAVTEETLEAVWQKLAQQVKPGDTVVFAGKNPPGMGEEVLARWIRALRQLGVRVCVDTVGRPMELALQEGPDVIKPNQEELAEIVGCSTGEPAEILAAAGKLVQQGVGLVAVSMGGDGAIFVTKEQAIRGYCPKVKVSSTVGAGDSMMAAIAHYLSQGCPLEEVARRAIAVSAATVTIDGTQAATMELIEPLLEQVRIEPIG